MESSVCLEGIHKEQTSDFYCWGRSSIHFNNRCRKNKQENSCSEDKTSRKLAHGQSPGGYFEAWCKIHNFPTIQSQSEYSSVDIVLINILIDLSNANIVLIEKEHAVTSSLEHFPLASWSWVEDLLNNKLPTGNRLAKAQYVLISVSKFCNTIIRLWVEQRYFSAFCKALANDFVKFWLFSVAIHSY